MIVRPGSTLGMLGGGQLGRMFVIAAKTMGYEVIVLDPDLNSPAGSMASEHLVQGFDHQQSLDYLAANCSAITTEFENIPAATLEYLAQSVPVHPAASALRIAQNRKQEKAFFKELGLLTADFLAIESIADIQAAADFKFPAILKTNTLGYDGKGQVVCHSFGELTAAFQSVGEKPCVLEQRINLACEVSVVLCRSQQGEVECFPVAENSHANGILDITLAPARISDEMSDRVIAAAKAIANGLDYCGVLAVEFFIDDADRVLVNEMAPRPHNSGHYTIDACDSSQFEQQVRMICGLPAGSCQQHSAVAMWNILGDIWPDGGVPAWEELLKFDQAKLHLYGKKEARPGRKMGHVNCLGDDLEQAEVLLLRVVAALTSV
ncbi:MAG: 5-(carboxyamino)imidazole ribonucleotide synthase [Gammaproteobacteria bacterium]|jgi:5-(carboxyamino)imidazole ribonucleotide synthase